MMKREVVNDPMVYVSPWASFEDDALAVLLAKVGEMNKMQSCQFPVGMWPLFDPSSTEFHALEVFFKQ